MAKSVPEVGRGGVSGGSGRDGSVAGGRAGRLSASWWGCVLGFWLVLPAVGRGLGAEMTAGGAEQAGDQRSRAASAKPLPETGSAATASKLRIGLAIADLGPGETRAGYSNRTESLSAAAIRKAFLNVHHDWRLEDVTPAKNLEWNRATCLDEAARRQIDLLIFGSTHFEQAPRRIQDFEPYKGDDIFENGRASRTARKAQVAREIHWRLIDVATQEAVDSIDARVDLSAAGRGSEEFVDTEARVLIPLILKAQGSRPRDPRFEIVFQQSEDIPLVPANLVESLNKTRGFLSNSVQMKSLSAGSVHFTAIATVSLAALTDALGQAFTNQFRIDSAASGRILLRGVNLEKPPILLQVSNLTVALAQQLEQRLRSPPVRKVTQGPMEKGVSSFSVHTDLTPKALALRLETGTPPLSIRSYSDEKATRPTVEAVYEGK